MGTIYGRWRDPRPQCRYSLFWGREHLDCRVPVPFLVCVYALFVYLSHLLNYLPPFTKLLVFCFASSHCLSRPLDDTSPTRHLCGVFSRFIVLLRILLLHTPPQDTFPDSTVVGPEQLTSFRSHWTHFTGQWVVPVEPVRLYLSLCLHPGRVRPDHIQNLN